MAIDDNPRPLDHLVLQVAGLEAARGRLAALGFNVAPDGLHPFGTANCCVFFADGTFLEPLDFADTTIAEREASAGNVFTRHTLEFRDRNGPEGLSALVYGTADAARDHGAFAEGGFSAGDILNFGRDFVAADGSRDRASFRLAFALAPQARDCLFFTCERVAVPKVDRSELLRHANGVTGISRVVMTAEEPVELSGILTAASRAYPEAASDRIRLRSGAFVLDVMTPRAFTGETGLPVSGSGAPRFSAVAFACPDAAQLAERLQAGGVDFHRAPAGLVVPPQAGQGAAFIFLSRTSSSLLNPENLASGAANR